MTTRHDTSSVGPAANRVFPYVRGDIPLGTATSIFGRKSELAAIPAFLSAAAAGPAALVLVGEAGIGKTTVWRAGVERTASSGYRVLTSRPAESEAKLSYAALIDLLEPALDEVLDKLPSPQRRALEVALLRAEPDETTHEQLAVSVAVLGAIRALACERPVVVAVDDVQWLDGPSASVLEFLVRRLRDEPAGLLLALRGDATDALPLALQTATLAGGCVRAHVGPLSVGALCQLISEQTGVSLSRSTLVRVEQISGGNPFFALEIARAIARSDVSPTPGEVLPVPDNLRSLLAGRIAELPADTQGALLFAAASATPTVELAEAGKPGALRRAIEKGVVGIDGQLVRFAHPLLAEVVYGSVPEQHRRLVHRRLAELAPDGEERARHLALAVDEPDEQVASTLADAARSARARGASNAAAELAERSASLTPPDLREALAERRLAAAGYHFAAGDGLRARKLVEEGLAVARPGAQRAQALQLAGQLHYHDDSLAEASQVLSEALAQAHHDLRLKSAIQVDLACCLHNGGASAAGKQHAQQAVRDAELAGDDALLAEALACLTVQDFIDGFGLDEGRMSRALALEDSERQVPVLKRPTLIHGLLLLYTGQLEHGQAVLTALWADVTARGEEHALPFLCWPLSWGAVHNGELERAERFAAAGLEAALMLGHASWRAIASSASALVTAYQGRLDAARAMAEDALALLQRTEWDLFALFPLEVLGFIELSREDPARVDRLLHPLAGPVIDGRLAEPGLLRPVPDEIEALVALSRYEDAESLLDAFEARARALDRAWALAAAGRCRGLLAAARGNMAAAIESLEDALRSHERVDMPFDLGRTLLVLGRVRRRARERGQARQALTQALAIFERIGTPRWADMARAELGRTGTRFAADELTPTEMRVAELAAQGLTNREIAAASFMSPKTVEANLSRIYRKLGISSRAELGAHMATRATSP